MVCHRYPVTRGCCEKRFHKVVKSTTPWEDYTDAKQRTVCWCASLPMHCPALFIYSHVSTFPIMQHSYAPQNQKNTVTRVPKGLSCVGGLRGRAWKQENKSASPGAHAQTGTSESHRYSSETELQNLRITSCSTCWRHVSQARARIKP